MSPGIHNITLYRGTRYAETLECIAESTGLAYDLSTSGPFVSEVREKEGSTVLVTITAEITATPTDGKIDLSAEIPVDVPLGDHKWGIIDAVNQLWIVGRATITTKVPEYT